MALLKKEELCELCQHGRTYRYDFARRCCRARHAMRLPERMWAALCVETEVRHGRDGVLALVEDVKAIKRYLRGK